MLLGKYYKTNVLFGPNTADELPLTHLKKNKLKCPRKDIIMYRMLQLY